MKNNNKLYSLGLASVAMILFLILFSSGSIAAVTQSEAITSISASPSVSNGNTSPDILNVAVNDSNSTLETSFSPVAINKLSGTSIPRALTTSKKLAVFQVTTLNASYDLRDKNKITREKDQGSAGVCWTFAACDSLESYLMPKEDWDFSENHMKNVLSNDSPEGFDRGPNDSGSPFMAIAYLARWSGPVNATDDPYDVASRYSQIESNLPVQKHIQDVTILPNRNNSEDNNNIKLAVRNYGALYTGMYYNDTYYSNRTYSYYYNGSNETNHGVTIVGWNDSYDKNRFYINGSSNIPPGDGAFIVKNSWNSSWGDGGYFYVSYYDSNIGNVSVIFTAESTDNYKFIYQYDPLGWCTTLDKSYNWCKADFTANYNETLKAVSFYTTDMNCSCEIYYNDPTAGPHGQILNRSTFQYAGYHTVPLPPGINLTAGKKFSLWLNITNPAGSRIGSIAAQYPFPNNSEAKAYLGQTFYYSGGWVDLALFNYTACIKAFTDPMYPSTLPVANFTSNVTNGYAPLSVQFTDQSKNATRWNWNFGDGNFSNETNPMHIYSNKGIHVVNLTVWNVNGTDSKYDRINISGVLPVANFTSNVTEGYSPLYVSFADMSENATEWCWDFENDGISDIWTEGNLIDHDNINPNIISPTIENPIYKYTALRNYIVNLTVSNANGTDSKYMIINVSGITPVANFTSNVTEGYTPLYVKFTDLSKNATFFCWDFDSDNYSDFEYNKQLNSIVIKPGQDRLVDAHDPENPIFKYTVPNNYTVTLIAQNENGTVWKQDRINVSLGRPIANFSCNVTEGYTPLYVKFTDLSKNATLFCWDFNNSNDRNYDYVYDKLGNYPENRHPELVDAHDRINPIYKYTAPGNYTVTLEVRNFDENGDEDAITNSKNITINVLKATPTITWNDPADIPYGTALNDTQLNAVAMFNGNNVPGNFVYTPGSETVLNAGKDQRLHVDFIPNDTANYSNASANVTINVSEKISPVADFSANPTSGESPLTVQFTDKSKNADRWNWDFGDGANSQEQSLSHIYNSKGTYTVTLTVTNENGTNSTSDKISVSEKPVADFIATPMCGYAPLTEQFFDQSQHADTYSWDFGDGETSTDKSPSHTYDNEGFYRVKLTVSNSDGMDSKTSTTIVLKKDENKPNRKQNSKFEDKNYEKWPNEQYTTITLPGIGTCVTFFSIISPTVLWIVPPFHVIGVPGPIPFFLHLGEALHLDFGYTFIIKEIIDDDKVLLEFDKDGQKIADKIIVVNNTSDKNWTLTRDDIVGVPVMRVHVDKIEQGNVTIDGIWIIDYENATTVNLPVANFSSNMTSYHTPYLVQFTDLSENATGWNWDFGDGVNSNEQNPMHNYSAAGSYIVNLTVNNANGTDWKFAPLNFSEKPVLPVADFIANPTSGYTPLTVQFTDKSRNADRWDWYFGDGANSTDQNPMHTYSTNGDFKVKLTVSNENGTDSTNNTINVTVNSVLPAVNFSLNITKGYAPLSVQFTDLSKNATTWNWNFGDGNSSTEQNPIHTYLTEGNYTVNLTVSNANGTNPKLAAITVLRQSVNPGTYTFITKWGSNGSDNGKFYNPEGVAVDSYGNVYVADTMNHRIQKFNSDGEYISKWGSRGSGDEQFNFPIGVAVDSLGNVYVADTENYRIQKFDSNGNFLIRWGSQGSGDRQFSYPHGVAVDSLGNVYVADLWNNRIQKFDSNGTFLAKWGSYGTDDGQFSKPYGVAVDSSGNVYVADCNNHRIQKFNSVGEYISKWDFQGSSDGQFKYPSNVAVDVLGNVYVNEAGNNRVQKLDSNGTFLAKWGSYGTDDGQFYGSYGIAVDLSGNVYVADIKSDRIQKFAQTNPVLPVAHFSSNVTSGYAPLSVQFTDLSKNATAWNWNFGDTATSNQQNPIHIYSKAGNYTVNLTASNANGNNTTTNYNYMTVGSSLKPITNISDETSNLNDTNPTFSNISVIGPTGLESTNLYLSENSLDSKHPGSSLIYTLYYQNFGKNTAQSVVLEDLLSSNVKFESSSDGGIYNNSTRKVTWNIGSVAPREHGYRILTVGIPKNITNGTVIPNNASINTSSTESRYDDNEVNIQTLVASSNLPQNVSVEPTNGDAGIPSVYYGEPITFSYHTCDFASGVNISIHIDDGQPDIVGNMSGGSSEWNYTTTFYPRTGKATVTYAVYSCNQSTESFSIYVDPAGYIYDIDTGNRIAGASVWLQQPDVTGGWENVPTNESTPVAQPDINPLVTDENGMYQWNVLNGTYRVYVEAPGYISKNSCAVMVPPAVTDLHVGLVRMPSVLPISNFSSNVTSGCVPLSVQFIDVSENSTNISWEFENDGIRDSTDRNPIHVYDNSGSYIVNLTVGNANGVNSKLAIITVLTPMQTVQQMINSIQGLVASGELSSGLNDSLIAALNAAKISLNSGNTLATIIELKAFISQVKIYINFGILSTTNGQTLIDEANAIINYLSNQVT